MAIYVGENKALLLKNDKSVVEFYKGDKKLFGYNNSKHGEIITADNVHPIEHKLKVKLSSDTITDFSTVRVMRCGKNLIPYPYSTKDGTISGVTFTTDENGVLTIDGTLTIASTGFIFFNKNNGVLKDGVNYRLSNNVLIKYKDENGVSKWANSQNTLTWKKEYILEMCYMSIVGTYNNKKVYPQLEIGTVATEYEPYIKSQTVTANADGTVDGLNSLSPNMTVLSDNNNAMIHISYC